MTSPVSDTVRAVAFCLLALLLASSPAGAETQAPQRIVSLNLCTDQLLMMLAQPDRIAAVSYHAINPDTSNLAEQALQLPITSTLAEDVITLKPDLVIAGTFTTRPTINLLQRLGVRVLEVPPANSVAEIRSNVTMIANAVGERRRGEEIIAQFDAELAASERPGDGPSPIAAPYYGGNNTSGSGTLLHELLERTGLRNLAAEKGMTGPSRLSLEQMVYDKPDLIVLGLSSVRRRTLTIGNLEHPAMHQLLRQVPSVTIPDRLWICGTPHIAKVVARLAEERARITARRHTP